MAKKKSGGTTGDPNLGLTTEERAEISGYARNVLAGAGVPSMPSFGAPSQPVIDPGVAAETAFRSTLPQNAPVLVRQEESPLVKQALDRVGVPQTMSYDEMHKNDPPLPPGDLKDMGPPPGPKGPPVFRNNVGVPGAGKTIPAHMEPHKETKVYGMTAAEEEPVQGYADQAYYDRLWAIEQQKKIDEKKAVLEGERAAKELAATQAFQAKQEQYNREREEIVQKRMATLDQQLQAAAEKSDPSHFWRSTIFGDSAGGEGIARVLGAISVGLGQYAAGRLGGQNAAMGIINSAIDRDIRAQEVNMANRRNQLTATQELLRQNLDVLGSKELSAKAVKLSYLESAKALYDQQAAQLGTDQARINAELGKAAITSEQAKIQQGIQDALHTKTVVENVWKPASTTGAGTAGKQSDNKLWVPTGDRGEGYNANTEKEAQQARDQYAAYGSMKKLIEEMNRIRSETGAGERVAGNWSMTRSKAVSELRSKQRLAYSAIKRGEGTGTWDDGSAELIGGMLEDYSSAGGNPEATGENVLQYMREKMKQTQESQGAQDQQKILNQTNRGDFTEDKLGKPSIVTPKKEISFKPIGAK